MIIINSKEVKVNFGRFLKQAQEEIIVIKKYNHKAAVLMSYDHFSQFSELLKEFEYMRKEYKKLKEKVDQQNLILMEQHDKDDQQNN